jgi:tetratricopeptide (TPR) repeat protein
LKKNYSRAEREFQLALASSPQPETMLARMTRYYIARGQVPRGISAVRRYLDSHQPTSRLYELLARLHLAQGAWAEAATASEKALALEPNRVAAHLYRGQALAREGRLDEAERSFERAIQASPQQLAPYLHLADLHWGQGDFSRAAEYYRKALNIAPNSPVAQAGLARALADAGQELDWALSLAQQAVQQRPEEPVFSDALAWIYHKKGLNNSALPLLQDCVAKGKRNPVFQFHLAMVYLQSGKEREGRRMLRAALDNGLGTTPYATQAEQTLSRAQRR